MTIDPRLLDAGDLHDYQRESAANGVTFYPQDIRDLLAHIAAQDRRIAELERQLRDTEDTLDVVRKASIERGRRADGLELRLSIATESNVNDRKRIAELEAIVSSTDDLVRQLRNALAAALEIGRAGEGNDLKWRTLTKHASQLLPSEET